jgi:hypothetical protein
MGVINLEVGYTSATTGRGDHEVHKGHVVALEKKRFKFLLYAHVRTSGIAKASRPALETNQLPIQCVQCAITPVGKDAWA